VELEDRIRLLREAGDLRGAASLAVDGYGAELFGFLRALLHNEHDASEVFSQTCEDLWVGLGRFEGRCSMRTWLYALARHGAAQFCRSPHRRPGRHVTPSALSQLAERVRTQTRDCVRTDVKDQFATIRGSLDEADRVVLILRVDRAMSWDEIARVFLAGECGEKELLREAVRLRKQFQSIKTKIRVRARQAGLLPDMIARPSPSRGPRPMALCASDTKLPRV
jgi:RNA polymerase sigma-70 factor (ECF subfamily)